MTLVAAVSEELNEVAERGVDSGRRAERSFLVYFLTPGDASAHAARSAVDGAGNRVPLIGEPHPDDLYSWAYNAIATQISVMLYRVRILYRVPGANAESGNPLNDPPKIRWTYENSVEAFDEDADGLPFANPNGEWYDPPLMIPVADAKIIIERNVQNFDPRVLLTYRNVVNADVFAGFEPGTALLKPIEADQITDNKQFIYWRIHAEVVFRVRQPPYTQWSWYRRVATRGFKVRPAPGQPPEPYSQVVNGQRVFTPTPVMLNEDGTYRTDQTQPFWFNHRIFASRNFADLNLL